MPRKTNPSKVAAAMKRVDDAVASAEDGKFSVGRVEKKLGNGKFLVRFAPGVSGTCQVAITGKVLRGGKSSDFHADLGDWIIYDVAEVQGIVTPRTPHFFKRLKREGRIPDLPELVRTGEADDAEEGGFDFVDEEDVDADDARKAYLNGMVDTASAAQSVQSHADADDAVRVARVAASRANAYKNRRATRDDRVAAALTAVAEDPELEAMREMIAERALTQSSADKERHRQQQEAARKERESFEAMQREVADVRAALAAPIALPIVAGSWEEA